MALDTVCLFHQQFEKQKLNAYLLELAGGLWQLLRLTESRVGFRDVMHCLGCLNRLFL